MTSPHLKWSRQRMNQEYEMLLWAHHKLVKEVVHETSVLKNEIRALKRRIAMRDGFREAIHGEAIKMEKEICFVCDQPKDSHDPIVHDAVVAVLNARLRRVA